MPDPFKGVGVRKVQPEAEPVPVAKPTGPKKVFDVALSPETLRLMEIASRTPQPEEEPEVTVAETPEVVEIPVDTDKIALPKPEPVDAVYYRGTPLDNPAARKRIEAKLSPLNFDELIFAGRVSQEVPIANGKMLVTFQSLKTRDNIFLLQKMGMIQSDLDATIWLNHARLVLSLVSVNERIYTDPFKSDGTIDEDKFTEKYHQVISGEETFVDVLIVNLGWFMDRVRRMFTDDQDQLKNG